MAKPPIQADSRIASLALAVTDLRAHFEAQLRAIARAEDALGKCRTARDPAAFGASAKALRDELERVSAGNQSVRGVIDQIDLDAREIVFPGKRRAT